MPRLDDSRGIIATPNSDALGLLCPSLLGENSLLQPSLQLKMGDESRPPGLVAQPAKNTSNANSGHASSNHGPQGGVGRGNNQSKSQNQQQGGQNQGAGRGKKNQAKQTSAAPSGSDRSGKVSNLSSFGNLSIEPTLPAKPEANGSEAKRAGRDNGKAPKKTTAVRPRRWVSTLSASEIASAPTCIICCDPIEFFAIGSCNHNEVCAPCTIRRRQIYGDIDCCICKAELKHIIVDREGTIKFEELWANRNGNQVIKGSSIVINDPAYFEYCEGLFDRKCPLCEDDKVYPSLNTLKKHAETSHGKVFCDLCITHRKCFLHEQKLYKPDQLPQHIERGDPSIQLKPHPTCEYCSVTFFSMEDLFRHCEEAHFKCFLCEAENILYQYFKNYDHLDKHFGNKHFACREPSCLEKKFVAFPTSLDLQAHNVKEHLPQEKKNAKNARMVHLDFGGPSTGGGRHNHDNGLSAAERALRNRPPQMPIFFPDRHRPVAKDTSAITLPGKFDEPKRNNETSTTVINASQAVPSSQTISSSVALLQSAQHLSSAERSKNLIAAVKAFLNSDAKFNTFRTLSADYRNSKITADAYYHQFILTFGNDIQVAIIFDEMVDLMPDAVKRAELKSLRDIDYSAAQTGSVNTISNQNSMAGRLASSSSGGGRSGPSVSRFTGEEFPTLAGSSGVASGPGTALTAPNYGKALSGSGGIVPSGGGEPTEAFPALPAGNPGPRGGAARGGPGGPRGAWGTGTPDIAPKKSGKKGKGKQFINL